MSGRPVTSSEGSASLAYEDTKLLAQDRDPAVRSSLTTRDDVPPEIVYFLACDPSPEVRRAVAESPYAPAQADLLLARDPEVAVREALTRKVAKLVPNVTDQRREQIHRHLIATLEELAKDQANQVRRLLADILQDEVHAPASVIKRLARDVDELVANPVLQFSPLLSQADLIEIINSGCQDGRLDAISRRKDLGEQVADAIIATDDETAIAALLENRSAQIREQALDDLVDRAAKITAWQEPLVERPALPSSAALKLSTFVANHLLYKLQMRKDLDPEVLQKVSDTLHRRLGSEATVGGPVSTDSGDGQISQAIAAGDTRLAQSILATLSGYPERVVERILSSGSAKANTALAWKAGLSMRTALQIQLRLAGLSPHAALHPAQNERYPLGDEEMGWQLEFFEELSKK